MIGYPFYLKEDNQLIPVRYAQGQGIGIYRSWAILALTHHILIRLRALRAGYDPVTFRDYIVLGDDVIIANALVAIRYQEIMSSLGVGISLTKRVLPSPLFGAEFASKIFANGEELSPLPFGLVLEGSSFSLFSLWTEIRTRVLRLPEHLKSRDMMTLTHAPDFGSLFPISGKSIIGTEWAFSVLYNSLYKNGNVLNRSGYLVPNQIRLGLLPTYLGQIV